MLLRPVQSLGCPGRTYKFFNGPVVYPFGYGLSYTTFNYKIAYSKRSVTVYLDKYIKCRDIIYLDTASKPSCPAVLIDDLDARNDNLTFTFDVEVENTGKMDGSVVVMVYWYPPEGIMDAPITQLIAFKKVFVSAGQSTKVNFQLTVLHDLGLVDFQAYTILAAGKYRIALGNDVASFPLNIKINK